MPFLRKFWRFFLTVAVSVLALGVSYSQVKGLDAETRREQEQARGDLRRHVKSVADDVKRFGKPANHAVAEKSNRVAALRGGILLLNSETSYRISRRYELPQGGSDSASNAFFNARFDEVTRWLDFESFWEPRVDSDDVGFTFRVAPGASGAVTPRQRLLRLDVLARVARAAEISRVRRVSTFKFSNAPSAGALAARMPGFRVDVGGDPRSNAPYQMLQAELVAEGTPQACAELLVELQRAEFDGETGRGLVVEKFSMSKTNPNLSSDQRVTLTAELVVLVVRPDATTSEASIKAIMERHQRDAASRESEATAKPDDGFGVGSGGDAGMPPAGGPPSRRR